MTKLPEDDFEITHGPDGKIEKAHLSSERAALIGSLGGKGTLKRRAAEGDELTEQVLAILPALSDPDKQRVRASLLAQYCQLAASGKGQTALLAIAQLARMVGDAFAAHDKDIVVAKGARCPTCQRPDPLAPLLVDGTGLPWLRRLLLDNLAKVITIVDADTPEVNRICIQKEQDNGNDAES